MRTYSNSQLSMYEQCPLKYKLRYLDRIKREFETAERLLGTIIHQVLKKCYDDYRFGRVSSIDNTLNYYNNLWKQHWNDSVIILKQDMTQESYRLVGEKMIGEYYRHYSPFDKDETLDTELLVSFYLDNEYKYRMIGYIDRLSRTTDGVLQIHDYKTSAYLPVQDDADNDRQLTLYQIGVQQKWSDIKDIRLIWHYLAFNMEMVSTRSPEDIKKLMKNTISLIDEIEATRNFLPRESGLCNWCEYPDLCPLRKHFVIAKSLGKNEYLNEQGVRLVDKYAALLNGTKEDNEEPGKVGMEIMEYASKQGMEVIWGSNYKVRIKAAGNFELSEGDDVESKELVNVVEEAGKWAEVFQMDRTSVAHIIENRLRSQELMDQILKRDKNRMKDSIQVIKLQDSERII
jgi:putative RecB family exonuclease